VIRPPFELAHFTVREGEEEALIAERAEMVRALRRAFPAARSAWLTRQDDGTWLDIVLWSSREAAEEATRRVDELPEARTWSGTSPSRTVFATSRSSTKRCPDRTQERSRHDVPAIAVVGGIVLAQKLLPPRAAVDVPLALGIVGLRIATVL
jgi:hypothetical protein